jgi:hypothetical protein
MGPGEDLIMSVEIRGKRDEILETIKRLALDSYARDHPGARITLYRYNKFSVRIRVVDPAFKAMGKTERDRQVWRYLEKLPQDAHEDISMLVLIAPEEATQSLGNLEFDNPSRSLL